MSPARPLGLVFCCSLAVACSRTPTPPAPVGVVAAPPADEPPRFPRRMLFVHVSRYLYLNPLTAGPSGGEDRTKPAALRLAHEWRIPYEPEGGDRNQLFVLSDTARGPARRLPLRSVVVGAYERFFATSRAQDRVVVYFGGHVLEAGGRPHLAPIEGDPDDPDTLIPLADFYDKLKACRATQKVVIWDVCRFNPERGRQRPGSGPMPHWLHRALAAAPPGVEVVVACGPGENALEFSNLQPDPGAANATPRYAGSSLLESMRHVARTAQEPPTVAPADPIPVAEWAAAVGRRVAEAAASPAVNLKQTVTVHGRPAGVQTPPDPAEAAARRVEFPAGPRAAPPAEVELLVGEFAVPPVRPDPTDTDLADVPFREEVMKGYRSEATAEQVRMNPKMYPFAAKTMEALDAVRRLWTAGGPRLRDDFRAPVNDLLRQTIREERAFWEAAETELRKRAAELEALVPARAAQPRRWQAHFDFARATVKARLAFAAEYDGALTDVLADKLPPLNWKGGQDSYKLVASDRFGSPDAARDAAEAAKLYARLAADHKGTPWAIQAKRDRTFLPGLAWKPFGSDGVEP